MARGSLRRAISSALLRRLTSSTTSARPMRTEMTSEAATATQPKRTAAPDGLNRPRVSGSVRSAARSVARVSMVRSSLRTLVAAVSQSAVFTARAASAPGDAATTWSSAASIRR